MQIDCQNCDINSEFKLILYLQATQVTFQLFEFELIFFFEF